MPHIFIEHSDHINTEHVKSILAPLHTYLVESLPTKLATCKSRILCHKDYLIGDGDPRNAFIHVNIRILPGRDEELVKAVSNDILSLLAEHFNHYRHRFALTISVDIGLLPTSYCKTDL